MNYQDQKPLTLTLSRRERGLTEVFGRDAPTCNTESNFDFEKPKNGLPFPLSRRERAEVRGKISTTPNKKRPKKGPFFITPIP